MYYRHEGDLNLETYCVNLKNAFKIEIPNESCVRRYLSLHPDPWAQDAKSTELSRSSQKQSTQVLIPNKTWNYTCPRFNGLYLPTLLPWTKVQLCCNDRTQAAVVQHLHVTGLETFWWSPCAWGMAGLGRSANFYENLKPNHRAIFPCFIRKIIGSERIRSGEAARDKKIWLMLTLQNLISPEGLHLKMTPEMPPTKTKRGNWLIVTFLFRNSNSIQTVFVQICFVSSTFLALTFLTDQL